MNTATLTPLEERMRLLDRLTADQRTRLMSFTPKNSACDGTPVGDLVELGLLLSYQGRGDEHAYLTPAGRTMQALLDTTRVRVPWVPGLPPARWCDVCWPAWVPATVREQIESFWSGGRSPADYEDNCYDPCNGWSGYFGQLGWWKYRDGAIWGRRLHAWNNIGRLIDDAGGWALVCGDAMETPPAPRPPKWRGICPPIGPLRVAPVLGRRWALAEESGEYTNFWSLEDALADRAREGFTTAVVRPAELALPRARDMLRFADDECLGAVGHFNENAIDVADFSDYARWDDVCEFRLRGKGEPDPCDDLARRFADAFRDWVLEHGGDTTNGDVSWGAWRFTGPARRFVLQPGDPSTSWMEICPKDAKHPHPPGPCTLALDHEGECVPESADGSYCFSEADDFTLRLGNGVVGEPIEHCPRCSRRVRRVVPAGGDGSARVFVRHRNAAGEPCPGSRLIAEAR